MRMNKKELSENGKNSCKAEGTMQEPSKKIFTIPNLLSMVRILLLPVFVWLYSVKKEYMAAFVVLLLSGVTDLLDGFIARRFHMISVLGKMLDPIADKLTQAAVLLSLGSRFPLLFVLAALFVLKEAVTGVMFLVVKNAGGAGSRLAWKDNHLFVGRYDADSYFVVCDSPLGESSVNRSVCSSDADVFPALFSGEFSGNKKNKNLLKKLKLTILLIFDKLSSV